MATPRSPRALGQILVHRTSVYNLSPPKSECRHSLTGLVSDQSAFHTRGSRVIIFPPFSTLPYFWGTWSTYMCAYVCFRWRWQRQLQTAWACLEGEKPGWVPCGLSSGLVCPTQLVLVTIGSLKNLLRLSKDLTKKWSIYQDNYLSTW